MDRWSSGGYVVTGTCRPTSDCRVDLRPPRNDRQGAALWHARGTALMPLGPWGELPHCNHFNSIIMKASTTNRARGATNIVKGDVKVATGKVTRNRLLQAKGRAQKLVGRIQKAVGKDQKADGC